MNRVRELVIVYRRLFVISMHLVLWTLSFLMAVGLRFDFAPPPLFLEIVPKLLLVVLLAKMATHWYVGLFHGIWRYSGLRDLRSLLQAVTTASIASVAVWGLLGPRLSHNMLPRSIFVLDWAFSILIVGGLRFGIRTLREVSIQNAFPRNQGARRRLLVVGANDSAEVLMREIVRSHGRRYEPVGILDDDLRRQGDQIHGVPVLGRIDSLADQIRARRVDEVVVAIPTLRGKELRRLMDMCRPSGVQVRTLPPVEKLLDGRVRVSQLSEVNIEDLLGRDPVVLDMDSIAGFVRGAVVLVTGAGGSIGSELCAQLYKFGPRKLILVEQAENSLFHVERALRVEGSSIEISALVADICDDERMERIFADERPKVVLHAAAHKHVPLMEANPGEAIKNNVFGTRKLADLSDRFGVDRFVMVSTDKAVNPSSIMGVSKRVAEIYVQAVAQKSRTRFITVRFGNVLGSAGSVVPVFRDQIAKGGPVTITHPEMRRYFMTVPEACQLVLQAAAIGRTGEILLLDMGQPVRIVDLARDLIRLSGLTPERDIEIRFTGPRPGEKLFEELSVDDEHVDKTIHPQIYVGRLRPHSLEEVRERLALLATLANGADVTAVRAGFKVLVPEYTPEPWQEGATRPVAGANGNGERVEGHGDRPSREALVLS